MDTVQDDSQVVPEGASPDATVPEATEPKAAPRTVMVPSGTVVLAATPIGNVGDASDRLKALLADADIVAAEDTRRLYDLANRLGVHVNGTVIAYHDHNERAKADGLLDRVETGATVLVVSDAGMPTINDPGLAIVRRAIGSWTFASRCLVVTPSDCIASSTPSSTLRTPSAVTLTTGGKA